MTRIRRSPTQELLLFLFPGGLPGFFSSNRNSAFFLCRIRSGNPLRDPAAESLDLIAMFVVVFLDVSYRT